MVLTLIKNDNLKRATHTENKYNNFQGTLEASPGTVAANSNINVCKCSPCPNIMIFPVVAELPMLYHCTEFN